MHFPGGPTSHNQRPAMVLSANSGTGPYKSHRSCGHCSPWLYSPVPLRLLVRFCTILYLTVLLKALAHKTRSYQSQQATVKGCKLLKRNNPPFSQRTENPSITQLISRASAPAYYLGGPPATVPQHSNHGLQQPTLPHIQTHTHTSSRRRDSPPPPQCHNAEQAYLPHEFTVRPRSEGCRHADTQVSPQ